MTKFQRSRRAGSVRNLLIVIAAVAALYLARAILIPLALAVTLALILAPAVAWLVKMHVGRVLAALATVVISVVAVGLIGFVIFNQVVQVLSELPSYQDNIHRKIEAMRTPAGSALGRATETVKELGDELTNPRTPPSAPPDSKSRKSAQPEAQQSLPVRVVTEPASEFQYLRDLIQPFFAPLASAGIMLIFTVFLLIEQDDLRNRLLRLAGMDQINLTTEALDDATHRVSRYLMLQFLVNACFGLLWGIALYLIGVPYAALWGAFAAILRIVPYLGSPIAGLLPVLLSLAVFDKWMAPLLVLIVFLILEVVTANFVEPMLFGLHTGISSLALLVAAVFWATFWGPAGLILSTPLTVCLVVLGRYIPQLSFLHILLGDQPVLPPEAQVYQRLLAMDHPGARLIVDQYLAGNSVLQLYDSIVIPVLTMLERDRRKGTLDPDREEFVFLSIREMLGDFNDRTRSEISGKQEPSDAANPGPIRPGRVLCVPAQHESDEIIAAILAQVLEQAGCVARSFTNDAKLEHMRHVGGPTGDDIILISALPPFAFASARTLTSQLQRRFPQTKVVVGIWGLTSDTTRALKSFQPPPDKIVTTLASTVDWMVYGEGRGQMGQMGQSLEPAAPVPVT